jgi:hypothetical protein
MKPYLAFLLLVSANYLVSCSGPRNIFSSSPFVSPVRMNKGAIAVETNYFSHSRNPHTGDSLTTSRDNGFGLTVYQMLKDRILLFVNADVMKEKNEFRDSTGLPNDPSFAAYDAGFDSSIVLGKRYSMRTGVEFFSNDRGKGSRSLAVSFAFHRMNMKEAGLLNQSAYHRFYKLNQISLSLQHNFLFISGKNFKLAWSSRLTLVNSFKGKTDYSSDEKLKTGLRDNRLNVLLCLTGIYAQLKPFNKWPVYLNGQVFNDMALWNRALAKYELGRTYVRGTGVSVGMKYIFFK